MSKFNSSVILLTSQVCYKTSTNIFRFDKFYNKNQFIEKLNIQKESIFSFLNKKHPNINFETIYGPFKKSCYLYYRTLNLTDLDYLNPRIAKNLIDAAWLSWSIPYSEGGLDRGGSKTVETNRANFSNLLDDIENIIFSRESLYKKETEKEIVYKFKPSLNKISKRLEKKIKEDLETKNERILVLENQIKKQKIILDEFFKESENIKNEIKTTKEINVLLDNKIIRLNKKCDCLKEEKNELETNKSELLKVNSKLLEDYEYYKACTIKAQEKIDDISKINSKLFETNSDLVNKINVMEESVNVLQNEYNKLKQSNTKKITKTINKNNNWLHIKLDKDFGTLSLKKFFLLFIVMIFSILLYIFEINFFSLFSLNISF